MVNFSIKGRSAVPLGQLECASTAPRILQPISRKAWINPNSN